MIIKRIELPPPTEYQQKQCELFLEYVFGTNEKVYKSRGSSSNSKIAQDILSGKAAECMVFNHYSAEGRVITPVDFAIYHRKKKSFDSDLIVDGYPIHVKSCFEKSEYPNSWLFQKQDSLTTKPNKKDMLLCVIITSEIGAFPTTAHALIVHAQDIAFKSLYSEPIAFPLKRTKVALYEKDLLDSLELPP